MEAEDDVRVTFRKGEVLGCRVGLPHIASYHDHPFLFILTDYRISLLDKLVPILVIISNRLIHKFICHHRGTVVLKFCRKFSPAFKECLLCSLLSKQRLICSIEMVASENVQVHNCPQIVLSTKLKCLMEQSECFLILGTVFKEHLLLINRDPHVVKTPLSYLTDIILSEILLSELAPCLTLRQPMSNVDSLAEDKLIIRLFLSTRKDGCNSQE